LSYPWLILFFYFFQRVFSRHFRNLLLEALNGRKKFENDEKNQNETGEDHRVDVPFKADEFGQVVGEVGENGNQRHSAPDNDSHEQFEKCLIGPAFPEIDDALIDHYRRDGRHQDLIKMNFGRHNFLAKYIPNHFPERFETVREALFCRFSH